MRMLSIVVISAMVTFSLTAADLTGTDLSGTWKGSMNTQGGETAVTITIKSGAALAGSIQAGEYETPIENASISGDKIFFEMKIGFGTVTYQGTVAGNQINFEVTGTQGDKYTLTCKRQSGPK